MPRKTKILKTSTKTKANNNRQERTIKSLKKMITMKLREKMYAVIISFFLLALEAESFYWPQQSIASGIASFKPNPQQLWLIQQFLAAQQQQPSLYNPMMSISLASVPPPSAKTNRIVELIFGPKKPPKSYSEKLETLSRRIAQADVLSHNDSIRIRNLNKDLINRLFHQKEAHLSPHRHDNKSHENKKLVELIQRIVDERLEYYLNKLSADMLTIDEPQQQQRSEELMDQSKPSTSKVFINEVQVKRKEARPRKVHVELRDSMVQDDDESVDKYYNEKLREHAQKLSLGSVRSDHDAASHDLFNQLDQESESRGDESLYEEQMRRQIRKLRRAEEKEHKKMLKNEMKAREKFNRRGNFD